MKAIIGSAIGVLALGLILVGAGLRGATSGAPVNLPDLASGFNSPNVMPISNTLNRANASGPVMIDCAAGQQALVRQVTLNGQPVSQVTCVATGAGYPLDNYGSQGFYQAPAAQQGYYQAPAAQMQRVSYDTSRSDIGERRVVSQEPVRTRVVQKRSSWKKPVMIIGGSTAAGAGIGGLIGGKKGALIGAALGGGASTIYEATRR